MRELRIGSKEVSSAEGPLSDSGLTMMLNGKVYREAAVFPLDMHE